MTRWTPDIRGDVEVDLGGLYSHKQRVHRIVEKLSKAKLELWVLLTPEKISRAANDTT